MNKNKNQNQQQNQKQAQNLNRNNNQEEDQEIRKKYPKGGLFKQLFGVLTFLYVFIVLYHLYYNIQVLTEYKIQTQLSSTTPEHDKTNFKVLYLVISLIPSILTALYGVTLTFFQNESKLLRKAWFFKICSLMYVVVIGHGLYKIFNDYWFEHHHNPKKHTYLFYHDYFLQFGSPFAYGVIFLIFAQVRQSQLKGFGNIQVVHRKPKKD